MKTVQNQLMAFFGIQLEADLENDGNYDIAR